MPPRPDFGAASSQSSARSTQSQGSKKGKEKALEVIEIEDDVEDCVEERARAVEAQDDRMWVDAYEPATQVRVCAAFAFCR